MVVVVVGNIVIFHRYVNKNLYFSQVNAINDKHLKMCQH